MQPNFIPRHLAVWIIVMLGVVGSCAGFRSFARAAEDKPNVEDKPDEKTERAALEKRFEETMRNVTLIGFFTASDQPKGKLTEERYIIEKVVKDEGDNWIFHARIQYGKNDVPVRLKIPVKWAGDTPVISVTKLGVPLLGTFNARVVIYDGQYAGTWDGAGHGGQLFGRIEKNKVAGGADGPAERKSDARTGSAKQ